MRALVPFAAVALFACSEQPGNNTGDITWYGDVEPVVYRVCANCHTSGGIGPGDFRTYEGAVEYAPLMDLYLAEGVMPPPVSDQSCHTYEGADHLQIEEAERQLMLDWIAAGTPEGDPAESLGEFEPAFANLDDTNLVLPLPVAHEVHADESGNQYRCFVLDYEVDQDLYLTAFELQPDAAEVAHHAILFADTEADPGESYDALGETSFDCANPIMERDWTFVHAWAPGMPPTDFGDDLAVKVPAGSKLVIQMHYYNPTGDPVTDQSEYHVRASTTPLPEMFVFPLGPTNLSIPAGAAEHTEEEGFTNSYGITVNVHAVMPHMHYLGTRYYAGVEHADDTETCVVEGNWDFNHQMGYVFPEPIPVRNGDRVFGSCTWDNSADNPNQVFDPPQTIHWGEGTDDEMCFFITYMSIGI